MPETIEELKARIRGRSRQVATPVASAPVATAPAATAGDESIEELKARIRSRGGTEQRRKLPLEIVPEGFSRKKPIQEEHPDLPRGHIGQRGLGIPAATWIACLRQPQHA